MRTRSAAWRRTNKYNSKRPEAGKSFTTSSSPTGTRRAASVLNTTSLTMRAKTGSRLITIMAQQLPWRTSMATGNRTFISSINWAATSSGGMQGDDKYYENDHGQRFVEKTAAYFPKTPWGAMGIKFFDY